MHVRSHQGPVSVIVFEERDKRRGDRNELLRRNVHILRLHPVGGDKFTFLPSSVTLFDKIALLIKLNICLADDVAIFFPRRQIERPRLIDRLLLFLLQLFISCLDILKRHVLSRLKGGVAAILKANIFDHAALGHAPIRRFDKAVFVDTCKARQR